MRDQKLLAWVHIALMLTVILVVTLLHIVSRPSLLFLRFPSIAFGPTAQTFAYMSFAFHGYQTVLVLVTVTLAVNAFALWNIASPRARRFGTISSTLGIFLSLVTLAALFLLRSDFLAIPPSFQIYAAAATAIAACHVLTLQRMAREHVPYESSP